MMVSDWRIYASLGLNDLSFIKPSKSCVSGAENNMTRYFRQQIAVFLAFVFNIGT